MTTKLERTSYTYNDKCSKKRLEIIQNRLKSENKTSDEKVKEIFSKIGVDVDLKTMSFTEIKWDDYIICPRWGSFISAGDAYCPECGYQGDDEEDGDY